MKNLTILSAVLFATVFLLNANSAKSDPGTGAKSAELNVQIVQEIKEVLQNPLLKYDTKDLTGHINITATVDKSGKIIFTSVSGLNENLKDNVKYKLNSLNLWTSSDYSGIVFLYELNYKN